MVSAKLELVGGANEPRRSADGRLDCGIERIRTGACRRLSSADADENDLYPLASTVGRRHAQRSGPGFVSR